jgi:Zn-dependent protease
LDPSLATLYAILAAGLFFLSLVLHELGHCYFARRSGIQVSEITLFALGGMAKLSGEPAKPGDELRIALAGPVVSLCLAVMMLGSSQVFLSLADPSPLSYGLNVLGSINLALALFNLVPAYPLDGGRVLRALSWRHSGDRDRATSVAAFAGQTTGVVFIALGILRTLTGAGLNGVWMVFIGWFLWQSASAARSELAVRGALAGVCAADLMRSDCPVVDRFLSVADLVQQFVLKSGRSCYAVLANGKVEGFITPAEIAAVARPQWRFRTVDQVMRPLASCLQIPPELPVMNALEVMAREGLNRLPVIREDGVWLGILSREDVLSYLRCWAQLHGGEPAASD